MGIYLKSWRFREAPMNTCTHVHRVGPLHSISKENWTRSTRTIWWRGSYRGWEEEFLVYRLVLAENSIVVMSNFPCILPYMTLYSYRSFQPVHIGQLWTSIQDYNMDPCLTFGVSFKKTIAGLDQQSGTEPMTILSDSLLPPEPATHFQETLVPCSPGTLLATDVAASTLRDLDEHEKRIEKQVGFHKAP